MVVLEGRCHGWFVCSSFVVAFGFDKNDRTLLWWWKIFDWKKPRVRGGKKAKKSARGGLNVSREISKKHVNKNRQRDFLVASNIESIWKISTISLSNTRGRYLSSRAVKKKKRFLQSSTAEKINDCLHLRHFMVVLVGTVQFGRPSI